ncbi:UBA domain-containing protein 3 [Leucoagaricus sp. SymC.cos]|nr:UBA domain-containing protein 3 [Leucoagaricus sp. SymC.cos]
MSTSSVVNKLSAERNQRLLLELASKPGNDICADCKARNPRWASYNLGIFICVACASIHRKIGTHISKVKSLTLDSWTKEQVDRMKEMGNSKSNAIYNSNEVRNPPPPRLDDPARDNDLEQYIRSKYEYRRFIDRNALVASKLGPSRSASSVTPRTTTHSVVSQDPPKSSSAPAKPEGVWADLISLQEPSANASLPLQYQAPTQNFTGMPPSNTMPAGLSGMGTNSFSNMNRLSTSGSSLTPFPQRSFSTNPFAQQGLQQQRSFFPTSVSTPSATPQIPSGFSISSSSNFQPQASSTVPFYQPQPQQSSLAPIQSQPQFLSPQLLPTTPALQQNSTTFNSGVGMGGVAGYLTPSPQPMVDGGGMPGQVSQGPAMGMQQTSMFGGAGLAQPQVPGATMNNPFGQMQFGQGGFPGQNRQQWGPLVACASIHRKIGTHISKVKSLTLDSWTKEQVDRMKEMGNSKSNAIYNSNEVRNPPPPRLDDPARDNDLEQYIRSKYEYRRFIDRNALVASKLGPSRSASSVTPRTTTHSVVSQDPPKSSSAPAKPEGVWADLISLQEPSANASLPLQYQAPTQNFTGMPPSNTMPAGLSGMGTNSFSNMNRLSTSGSSLTPFPQRSFSTNPFAQQGLQQQRSFFPTSVSTPSATPQIPSGFSISSSSNFQPQASSTVPFYQPQPQQSSLAPIQSQPQFLSPQLLPTTPALQQNSTTFNSGVGMGGVAGYLTPSPQPMVDGGGMPGQVSQGPAMGMQQTSMFGGAGLAQPQVPGATMNNPFGQMQFGQGGFPGQNRQQWGPL